MDQYCIKSITVLGQVVGNLWDVYQSEVWLARISYHGSKLTVVKGKLTQSELASIDCQLTALLR